LLVLGVASLTSRQLADRELANPPNTIAPVPRQAAPLWTAKGAASEPLAPEDRSLRAAGDLVVATTGFGAPSGRTSAYDARTGELRWVHRTGPNAFVTAVGGGWVVVAPQYGPLIGLDLTTGKERWRFELAADQGPESGTIAGDTLFVGTSFPTEGAVAPPIVYALELASGRQRWRAVLDPGTDLEWAAPVVDGGQVLVADTLSHEGSAPASHLHALDAGTGQRRWKADLHAPQQGFFDQGPVAAGGLAYLATASRMLLAVDTRSGREVWHDERGFPVLAGIRTGQVIALVGDRLVGFDAASGDRRWQTTVGTGAGGGAHLRRHPGPPRRGRPRHREGGLGQRQAAAGDRSLVTSGRVVTATRNGTLLGFAP
jgi:outer membrane protein assembly factor BamB